MYRVIPYRFNRATVRYKANINLIKVLYIVTHFKCRFREELLQFKVVYVAEYTYMLLVYRETL